MPPAQRHRRLRRARIVVAHGFAVGGFAGEAVFLEAVAAQLPAEAARLARGGGCAAPHPAAAAFEQALRGRRAAAARDDLDDAADGVSAVERALRTAHHLDAFDVSQRHLRQVHAAAEGVGADAIDEHQGEVRFAATGEERRERTRTAALLDRQPGHRAQRLAGGELLARGQGLAADHGGAVRHARQWLVHLRGSDHQLFVDGRDSQRQINHNGCLIADVNDMRSRGQARRGCLDGEAARGTGCHGKGSACV